MLKNGPVYNDVEAAHIRSPSFLRSASIQKFSAGSEESNEMAAHCVSTVQAATAGINQFRHRNSVQLAAEELKFPCLGSPTGISLQPFKFRPFFSKHSPIKATISLSLPTSNPDAVVSLENAPKWSSKSIRSFAMAELEARKLKYLTTGTEALVMGILNEGTNFASKYLWSMGITLFKVREETIRICGEANFFNFSPEHPPLTEDAQKALDWALNEKVKEGDGGEITTIHLLLGVWSQEGSPGYKVLATLGFNDEKAQELKALISKPGFKED
nr:ATP-dependent Clp protease ATP-binding subunit CLPT2, chloroplastic-like [Ipomoea batatas]